MSSVSETASIIFIPIFLGHFDQVFRDFDVVEFRAQCFVAPDARFHRDQIDDTLECFSRAHRNLHRHGTGVQTVDNRFNGMEEVGAHAVHLIDEANARHFVLVGLTPDSLGLRLHASDSVKHGYRAIENNVDCGSTSAVKST